MSRIAFILLLFCCSVSAERPGRRNEYLSAFNKAIPQVIFGGEWISRFTLTNIRTSPVTFPVQFYDAGGKPMEVPLIGLPRASTYTVTIPAGGQILLETPYTPATSARTGSGWIDVPCTSASTDSCGNVHGSVTLRNRNPTRPDFEAVYSFRTGTNQSILPIYNVDSHQTALMVTNESYYETLPVTVTFRDHNGTRILVDQFILPIHGTTLIYAHERWPAVANLRGTAEFTALNYSMIVTAIRINPTNSYTPIEAFEP